MGSAAAGQRRLAPAVRRQQDASPAATLQSGRFVSELRWLQRPETFMCYWEMSLTQTGNASVGRWMSAGHGEQRQWSALWRYQSFFKCHRAARWSRGIHRVRGVDDRIKRTFIPQLCWHHTGPALRSAPSLWTSRRCQRRDELTDTPLPPSRGLLHNNSSTDINFNHLLIILIHFLLWALNLLLEINGTRRWITGQDSLTRVQTGSAPALRRSGSLHPSSTPLTPILSLLAYQRRERADCTGSALSLLFGLETQQMQRDSGRASVRNPRVRYVSSGRVIGFIVHRVIVLICEIYFTLMKHRRYSSAALENKPRPHYSTGRAGAVVAPGPSWQILQPARALCGCSPPVSEGPLPQSKEEHAGYWVMVNWL